LFDFPGGLAAADTMAMISEDIVPKAASQYAEPVSNRRHDNALDAEVTIVQSCQLDFYLLSSYRMPLPLQTQLFTDICLRARRLVVQANRCLATMEEAICHCIGFGVDQDHSRYLAMVKECCEAGYQPAQASLPQIHHALGFPLGDGDLPYPIARGGESHLPESLIPFPYSTDLHRTVVQRNQTALVELIRNGASAMDTAGPVIIHKQHSFALDAVQLACSYHDAEMLEILLDAAPFYPINVDRNTTLGLLYFAIQCQNTHLRMARYGIDTYFQLEKTIQLLLRRGAANIVDKDGMRALHLAAACDMPEILEYVLTVDVLTQDINTEADGKTPLDIAIFKGRPAAFDLLVAAGAEVSRSSLAGHALNIPVQVTPSNDYFLKKTLELGAQSLTSNDKNTALEKALQLQQWAIADFLMSQGANINGLTMYSDQALIQFTVFGGILSSWDLGGTLAVLDCLMSLAAKHQQEPQFIVCPTLHSSALHVVAGKISAMAQEEAARVYHLLLAKFPSKDHLEARDYRGFTALHLAVSVRNVVAVRALLDAGADINSMALVEGYPAGQSPKDMAFGQFFSPPIYLDFEPGSRDKADRALEQLINLFTSERYSKLAKRSITLRAEQRASVTARHRQVMDYVDELAQHPRPLHPQHSVSLTDQLVQGIAGGDKEEAVQKYQKTGHVNVGKSIEWAGIECVRFLRHEGAGLLRDIGLLDDYLSD
jgi:ankyrin repeat protein